MRERKKHCRKAMCFGTSLTAGRFAAVGHKEQRVPIAIGTKLFLKLDSDGFFHSEIEHCRKAMSFGTCLSEGRFSGEEPKEARSSAERTSLILY
ncbi:MAG: hypothetical protein HKO75_01085 [Flavobacteriaceae bacterium]|nr:hypothetical protein [Muriicola sp.]NNL38429.1 hypothetical protein [Flavobacteriaceae bacterium]